MTVRLLPSTTPAPTPRQTSASRSEGEAKAFEAALGKVTQVNADARHSRADRRSRASASDRSPADPPARTDRRETAKSPRRGESEEVPVADVDVAAASVNDAEVQSPKDIVGDASVAEEAPPSSTQTSEPVASASPGSESEPDAPEVTLETPSDATADVEADAMEALLSFDLNMVVTPTPAETSAAAQMPATSVTEAASPSLSTAAMPKPRPIASSAMAQGVAAKPARASETPAEGMQSGDPVGGEATKAPRLAEVLDLAAGADATADGAGRHEASAPVLAKPEAHPASSSPNAMVAGTAPVSTPSSADSAPAQAGTPLPGAVLDNAEDQGNVDRVARGLRTAVNQGGGTVTLRLNPPELGLVRIQMEVQDGVVSAKFTTEHESVRHLLNQQMGQLREALQRQGLSIDRLDVQTQATPSTNGSGQASNQQQGGADQSPGDGRSRGEYGGGPGSDSQRQSPRDQQRRATFERELLNMVG